jgi:hypothetical protein
MPVTIIKSDKRAREKPCLRCEYSLRKIDSTHCPECGLSVWLSLSNNDSLEWSRADWLRRMTLGLMIMTLAQGFGMVPYALLLVAMFGGQASSGAAYFGWVSVAKVCAALYLVAYHIGLFIVTGSERRYPDRLKGWRVGSWIVGGVAALFGLLLLVWAASPRGFGLLYTAMNFVVLASALVTLGYLRILAKRIPNSTLAKICAWMMLVPVIPFLKVFPIFGLYLIMQSLWLAEVLPVIYLPLSAVLFVVFAMQFRRAAASADKSWAVETAMAR